LGKKKAARKTQGKKKSAKSAKRKGAKNSLVGNINRRKKAGTSRRKQDSTISDQAYSQMQKGWPDTKRKKK
jgi:hypothetical protein